MAVFFFLLLLAVALDIVGVATKGLLYLFFVGIVVLLLALVTLGFRSGRRRRRPAR